MFSWLKSRGANRRVQERQYVLDVKLRTRQTRLRRMRATGLGLGIVAGLAAAGWIGWRGGQWLLDRLVYKNSAFAIQRIDALSDGVLVADTLRHWAMVTPGQNLLALDLMKVKRDLEMRPPIESAVVERVLPHVLRISVKVRQPLARAFVQEGPADGPPRQVEYDLDQAGFAMRPLDPRWLAVPAATNQPLPELVGVSALDLQPGRQVESPQIRAALRLLAEFDSSPMVGLAELERINVTAPELLDALTTQGARVTFSLDHFDRQLRRWRQIYDELQKSAKAIAWLDLSVSNNVPVLSVAGAPAPLPLHKSAKVSHPKKKNV